MTPKQLLNRLDRLQIKLWKGAITAEKLHDFTDELTANCEDVQFRYGADFDRKLTAQKEASRQLRQLSWELFGLDEKYQELAWKVDELIDLVDGLQS